MLKRALLLIAACYWAVTCAYAQSHTTPVIDETNAWTAIQNFNSGVTSSIVNNVFVAGTLAYPTIAAAAAAADPGLVNCSFTTTCGMVLIPPKYAGTDNFNNAGINLLIEDRRSNLFNAPSINVPTFITSIDSDATYPAGRDMNFLAGGPAGMFFRRSTVDTTTTASLSVGANTSVLIGTVNNHNVDLGNIQTGTSLTLFSIGTAISPQKLYIGRETANNESLTYSATSGCPTSGTWNIVDATHLCLNTTKTHAGTTDIEEPPDPVRFDFTDLQMRSYQARPSQDATTCLPVFFNDTNGVNLFTLPSDTTCAAPRNIPAFNTGFNIYVGGGVFSGSPISTSWEAFTLGGPNFSMSNIDQSGTIRGFVGPFYGGTTNNGSFGMLRMQNGTFITQRNAANTDDSCISLDANDQWYLQTKCGGSAPRISFFPLISGTSALVACNTSQKSESAADANLLTCAMPFVAGTYRLHVNLSLSAASAATLGWTATWTDSNGTSQAPTNLPICISSAGTCAATTGALSSTVTASGDYYVDTNAAATSIVLKLTFSGTSFTAKVSATVEKVI
jgi:hypothetical protein